MARSPRSRIRERLDVRRLGVAVSYPGIDPRVWLSYARVDDDADAVRWDAALGWIADCTILGGGSDQEGPVACRIGQRFVADQGGDSVPVTGGEVVIVAIPEGNLNVGPVIVAVISSTDLPMPASVNGQDIDEDFAKANLILVTDHSVQQEVGEKWRTSATSRATLEAPEVRLANEDADQSYVRGDDRKTADDNFLTAFTAWIELVRLGIIAGGGTLDNSAMTRAISQYQTDIANALSSKIKGE